MTLWRTARGPLRFGHVWIWLFPDNWRFVRDNPPSSIQIGPVFVDWYDRMKHDARYRAYARIEQLQRSVIWERKS